MHRIAVIALLLVGCHAFLGSGASPSDDPPIDGLAGTDAAVDSGLPAWSSPTKIAGLPSATDLDDPTLTNDMLEMYFNMSGDIYVTRRASISDSWSAAVAVAELDSAAGETTPDISGDGLTMYFASQRAGGLGDYDIWMSKRASRVDAWGAPVHVPELSSTAGDATAAMTQDQLMVVTTSNRKDGTTYDLYTSTRATVTDAWGPLVELASLDRASIDDTSGFLSSDGLAIYFETGDPADRDIYYAQRANRGDAFAAKILIDELRSQKNDFDPWLSPDQRHIFFASDRGGVLALYEATR